MSFDPYIFAAFGVVALLALVIVIAFLCLPRLPYNLRKTRQETEHGFDELIVPEYLIATEPFSITFNEDGALTTGYRLTGPDATTKSEGALDRLVNDMNAVYSSQSVGWMYEFQRVRKQARAPEEEPFCPTATHAVLRDARANNVAAECWDDDVALLLTYLPPEGVSSMVSRLLINEAEDLHIERDPISDALRALADGCRIIEATLRTCMVTVHRLKRCSEFEDELVNVLFRNINGWSLPFIALPDLDDTDPETGLLRTPLPLRERLAVQDFDGALWPLYGREYIRLISLSTFPAKRRPQLLKELAQLAIPYRDHTRLIVGHPEGMLTHLQRRFNDAADDATPVWVFGGPKSQAVAEASVNVDATKRLKQIQTVIGEHISGERLHSWYSRVIEIRSESLDDLDRWERAIAETLRVVGFGVRIEDLHSVDAWLSTHGGNGYNFVRRTAAHGITVGDLSNLTDAWRGRETIKCDKCEPGVLPMAMVRRADTLAPFALDLHAGEGDVMSSVVVGPVRFGKTTLVNFIIGHFRKTERDRVVGIDYLRGEERTAVMLGGAYGAPGDPMSLARLCPFIGLNTVDGRRRAVEWCELVAMLNTSEGKVSGDLLGRFTEAVDLLRSSPTWENEACVTLFLQKLSADKPVKDAFRHYAEGGIYGHIFDATPNEMHAWQRDIRIYDTTVLHSLSTRAVFPALVILCADTERQIDGRRMLLVIEEAHIALKHPWMEPWLITLLRTNRKKHLGIIFVLTDLEGIAETTLRTLKSLCGTVFATQNPNVHATRSAYQFLGFDNAQIEQLVPSRVTTRRHDGMPTLRYQYWQLGEDGVAPFVLDLSPEELETYARGNDRDKARTAAALQNHPEVVPAAIFEAVKLPDAAEAWRSYFDDLPPAIAAQSVPLAFAAPQQEKLSA